MRAGSDAGHKEVKPNRASKKTKQSDIEVTKNETTKILWKS